MTHDPKTREAGGFEKLISNLVGRRLVWVGFIAIVISLPLAKALTAKLPPAPPKLRQVPEFTLTDQDGHPFSTSRIAGRLWVADFIYTSCGTICPRLTQAMAEVKHRARNMKGAVSFVSFTVDPVHDTPEMLQSYAEKNHARGDWMFLTGSLDNVRTVIVDGFQLGFGRHGMALPSGDAAGVKRESSLIEDNSNAAADLFEVAHGQQLLLVDKDRWIRGTYSPDPAGLNRLVQDMGYIANMEGYVVTQFDPVPTVKPPKPAVKSPKPVIVETHK